MSKMPTKLKSFWTFLVKLLGLISFTLFYAAFLALKWFFRSAQINYFEIKFLNIALLNLNCLRNFLFISEWAEDSVLFLATFHKRYELLRFCAIRIQWSSSNVNINDTIYHFEPTEKFGHRSIYQMPFGLLFTTWNRPWWSILMTKLLGIWYELSKWVDRSWFPLIEMIRTWKFNWKRPFDQCLLHYFWNIVKEFW